MRLAFRFVMCGTVYVGSVVRLRVRVRLRVFEDIARIGDVHVRERSARAHPRWKSSSGTDIRNH